MKQNNFTQQTHFIGVLLPEDLTLTLQDCHRYMNEAYGCKSGHGTPIHVTLVPPFRLQEDYTTEEPVRSIEKEVLPQGLGFSAHIENFDACPGCTKKNQRPFQPHATISNRDIPAGVTTEALQVMNELNLVEDFPVDNITIFERRGSKWESVYVSYFGTSNRGWNGSNF